MAAACVFLFSVAELTACAEPTPLDTAAEPVHVDTASEVRALAPDFTLLTVNGLSVTLSNYQGKPVTLTFWATWCPYCRNQIPYLLEASGQMAKEGLEFITVSREKEATIRKFMQEQDYVFIVALDSDGTISKSYQIDSVPRTFFIDSDGVITATKIGAFKSTSQVLSELEKMGLPIPATAVPETVLEVGTLAPDFTLRTLNGSNVKLSAYRGQPVVLTFWDSWCEPCRRQIPYLLETSGEMAKEGLEFITVNREEEATLRKFMQEQDYNFVVALDSDGAVWGSYHISRIPHTFLIDSDGIIRAIRIGAFENKSQVLDILQKILADK